MFQFIKLNFFQGFLMGNPGNFFAMQIDWLHNYTMSLLLGVMFFVTFLIVLLFFNPYYFKSFKVEYQFAEFLCSAIPVFILVMQAVPSLSLLYSHGSDNLDSELTIKVVGHQWYWEYQYADVDGLEFDSYMKTVDSLNIGEFRLLEVDNRCVVPVNTKVRFCVTSADVIHSWAIPSLGIKMDCMSGVMNSAVYHFPFVGVFYGQCSEICGANHSFMPISIEVTLMENFISWCESFLISN